MMSFIKFMFFASLAFAIFYAIYKAINLSSQDKQITHALNETLFNDNERKFYKALSVVIGNQYLIQAKIRILKFVDAELRPHLMDKIPSGPGLLRLSQKRFDFILFDLDGRPRLVIELENSPHDSSKRQERNALIEMACDVMNVPLFYVQVQPIYGIEGLKKAIAQRIPFEAE